MTRAQAEGLGVTARMRRARLRNGAWVRALPGVYRLAAVPGTPEQTLLAVCLWAGDDTVISHRTAAALWGLEGFTLRPGEPMEVTTARDVRTRTVRVHLARHPRQKVLRNGLPLTTVARTLLDLCAVAPESAEHAMNDALRRRLVSLPELQYLTYEDGGHGTPGLELFRRLLSQLELAGKPTDSWLETGTAQLLARAGFKPRRQHRVLAEGRTYRLDFAFPEQRVGIEAQGYRFHHTVDDWAKDQARHSALTALGWRLLLVTAHELKHKPQVVVARLRRLLEGVPEPGDETS